MDWTPRTERGRWLLGSRWGGPPGSLQSKTKVQGQEEEAAAQAAELGEHQEGTVTRHHVTA